MKRRISIKIDKLINSIKNVITEEVFDTEVLQVTKDDLKLLKYGWAFDWIKESEKLKVFKLTTKNNNEIIQGLISLKDNSDHIFINLIESANFNIGKNKVYEGVAANLFAFSCKFSFDQGYSGNVSFVAKTNLISHYEDTIKAKRVGSSNVMALDYFAAKHLVEKYFKE